MSTSTAPHPPAAPLRSRLASPPRSRFDNGQEWLDSLGNVPLDRILWNPWPGTATETDLLRLVEVDKRLCELIDGTLVEKPVGLEESAVASAVIGELYIWNRTGQDAFVFSGADSTLRMALHDRIRLPDVAGFARSRLPGGKLPPEKVPAITPDLVVEVLSESNTKAEMRQKLVEYFDNGTRLAWIVDPKARTVAVHESAGEPAQTLSGDDVLDGGEVLPGFEVKVSMIFRDLP